jgi:hypothetical protein
LARRLTGGRLSPSDKLLARRPNMAGNQSSSGSTAATTVPA